MANPAKDQIKAEFQKAKVEGSVRVDRIRTIFRDAFSQTVAELKDGSGELRDIVKDVKDAVLTAIATPADVATTTPAKSAPVVPVVVEIEDETTGDDVLSAVNLATPARLSVTEQSVAETAIESESIGSETASVLAFETASEAIQPESTATEFTGSEFTQTEFADAANDEQRQSGFAARIQAFRVRQIAQWQQDYATLKQQAIELDQRLDQQYGDRYAAVKQTAKQQVAQAKNWYDTTKAKAEASETDPIQQQQVELDRKVAKLGVTAAQREQEIKQQVRQQVKQLFQTAVSKM